MKKMFHKYVTFTYGHPDVLGHSNIGTNPNEEAIDKILTYKNNQDWKGENNNVLKKL